MKHFLSRSGFRTPFGRRPAQGEQRARRHGAFRVGGALAAVAILGAACSSTSSSAASSSSSTNLSSLVPASIRSTGTIIFGSPETNPPQLYLNSKQHLTGIDYEFGAAIAKELGLKAKWVNTPFDSLIPAIDAGRIDVVLNSMDDTVTREKELTFVDYEKDGALLLVAKGDPAHITTLASMCGKSISLLSGSYQVTLVQNQQAKCKAAGKPPITVQQYESVGDAILAVQSGRDDAFFASLGAAIYHQETAPNTFSIPPHTLVYAPGPIGAAVLKGNDKLAKAIQKAFQVMFTDGTYTKILRQFNYLQGGYTAASQFVINGGDTFNLYKTEPLTS